MELVILVLIIVLIFGAKKLPEASRSLGRSLRIFKSEMKEMGNDDARSEAAAQQQAPAQLTQQAPSTPVTPVTPAPQDTAAPAAPTDLPPRQA
nr:MULTISPECIES: Sec-independent protein translocase subunit TatA [Corynebacterium]